MIFTINTEQLPSLPGVDSSIRRKSYISPLHLYIYLSDIVGEINVFYTNITA